MKTLADFINEWLVKYKRNSVKASTYDRLETAFDQFTKYPIANIPIEGLTTDILQDYVNCLVNDGYALTTIKKQFHLLTGFIEYANLRGLIQRPIHKGVRLPTESVVKKHRKSVVAYSDAEQKKLLDILERGDSDAFYAVILMMETGMRAGEVLALSWDDIDFKRRSIRVSKTMIRLSNNRTGYNFIQHEAKSFSSNRIIPLSTRAYSLLELHRLNADQNNEAVFKSTRGDYLTYESLRFWTKKACDEAKVPYYGQHVFRHTFATNCYNRGCDVKLLSKLLGHADVTITYNVYIHLFGDALEELRTVIG